MAPEFLTIPEVAVMLRVSPRTVIRWTSAPRDRLLAMRFRGTTRIRKAALETWLRAREKAS